MPLFMDRHDIGAATAEGFDDSTHLELVEWQ